MHARQVYAASVLTISISICCTGGVEILTYRALWHRSKVYAPRGRSCVGRVNFKVDDMEDLFRVPDGYRCATNQVPYNVGNRGVECDLLPWCEQYDMPVMAYSPLGGNGFIGEPTLARIGAAHDCSPTAVALAWTLRSGNVIAIPESGSVAHVKENAVALSLILTPQELQTLDAAHFQADAPRARWRGS